MFDLFSPFWIVIDQDAADDFIAEVTFKSRLALSPSNLIQPLVTFCTFQTFLAGK